jgi:hypothetical protein
MIEETNVLQPNPLMEKLRIPGESFRLPSHGLFYSNSVMDESVRNGELELYPMTTIDEIVISTPDKLLSGKAISEVFAHCIPQITNTHAVLAKDVDFLLVCLRMVSFGQFMDVLYTHNCDKAREHTYSVDLQEIIRHTKSIDPTTINQEYTCTLSNGQVVSLKPMTYGDIIDIYQSTVAMKTNEMESKDTETLIINTLISVISNVDGITSREHIREWATKLSLGHKKKIQEGIQAVSEWGIDMVSHQKCKDCGESVELRVSANPVSFFT